MMNAVIFLSLLVVVSGHTLLTNLTIAGVTTNSCLRPTMNWDGHNAPDFPIMANTFPSGILGINYTCGWTNGTVSGAALPSKAVCNISAGSTVKASWWHGAIQGEDPVVDSYIHNSHRGPFIVYMAKWDQNGGLPTGPAWFKIYESGVLKDHREFWNMEWTSPHGLNANSGGLSFQVPSQLAPGRYLMRFEIIALHDTIKQPYVRCADVRISGSGTVQPSSNLLSIPGSINLNDPGFTYNLYQLENRPAYIIPGGRPFNFAVAVPDSSTIPTSSSKMATTSTSQMSTSESKMSSSGSKASGTSESSLEDCNDTTTDRCECDNTCDASLTSVSLLIIFMFAIFLQ